MRSTSCVAALTRLGRRRWLPLSVSSLSSVAVAVPSIARPTAACTQDVGHPKPISPRFTAAAAAMVSADSVSQRLPPSVLVECASSSRPHPDKRSGEDTYSVHASPAGVTLAVYDGVGSWSFEQGVDVSLFSKRIKQLTDEQLTAASSHSASAIQPAELLESVWQRLSADRVLGSCTACIVSLSASSHSDAACRLSAVTLGDSGFLVLRRRRRGEKETDATESVDDSESELSVITSYSSGMSQHDGENGADTHSSSTSLSYYVHYRSLQQLHYFNCPFQLGFTGDSATSSSSSSPSSAPPSPFDLPSSARSSALSLRADDVVVLSSDGLFDNVDERQIVQLVSHGLTSGHSVSEVSASLAAAAFERSVDKRVDGPFAYAAKDHNILWSGGRKDDITVILAHITQQH